jgi:putative peptidoglycan lipid II flippase
LPDPVSDPVRDPAGQQAGDPAGRRAAAGFLGAAAMIAVVTVLARVIGFGRYAVFSATVGADCIGNAYSSANVLPNILFEVVAGGALAGAVVPLLAGAISRHDRGEVDAIASALLGWVLVVLVPASLLLALLAGPISAALADNSCAGERALVARMIVVFAPQIALYGIGVVLAGTLQAHRRFFWPAFAPLLSSAVVIVGYLMYAMTSDDAKNPSALPGAAEAWLVWGTTAAVAAMTLPLLVPVWRAGIRLRPRLTFPPGIARRGRALALAGVGTLLAQQLSVLAGVVLANHAPGAAPYTVFTYAQAVYLLPYAVLAVPLATSAFPRLAERAAMDDRQGFAEAASVSTRAVVVAGLLGVAVLTGTAPGVGAFFTALDSGDRSDLTDLAPALVVMAPGVLGFALIAHIGRALYALHRGRAAAVAIASGWLVVVAGSVIAVPLVGAVAGLAAGNTAGMVVAGALLLVALHRCAGPAAVAGLTRLGPAGTIAAAAGGAGGWWVSHLLVGAGTIGTPAIAEVPAIGAGVAGALTSLVIFAAILAALDRTGLALVMGRNRWKG